MTAEEVARIVEHRAAPGFLALLRNADVHFQHAGFESELAQVLRREPALVGAWAVWSGDQRSTPSAWFHSSESGWVTTAGDVVERREHEDEAAAAANFIRRLAGSLG